jgi:hypothetical protein
VTTRRSAEQVAELIGKSGNWVRRNAHRLPHSRAGQTYFWTDQDVADLLEFLRVRPASAERSRGPQPITGTRRAS